MTIGGNGLALQNRAGIADIAAAVVVRIGVQRFLPTCCHAFRKADAVTRSRHRRHVGKYDHGIAVTVRAQPGQHRIVGIAAVEPLEAFGLAVFGILDGTKGDPQRRAENSIKPALKLNLARHPFVFGMPRHVWEVRLRKVECPEQSGKIPYTEH